MRAICNFALVLQLCSCYMRIHSVLANQKRAIFSCTLLGFLKEYFLCQVVTSRSGNSGDGLGLPPKATPRIHTEYPGSEITMTSAGFEKTSLSIPVNLFYPYPSSFLCCLFLLFYSLTKQSFHGFWRTEKKGDKYCGLTAEIFRVNLEAY